MPHPHQACWVGPILDLQPPSPTPLYLPSSLLDQCCLAKGQSVNPASRYHSFGPLITDDGLWTCPLDSAVFDNKRDAGGIFSAPPAF